MTASKILLGSLMASFVGLVALQGSLKLVAQKSNAPGCPAYSDSGLIDPTETVAIWENHPIEPILALSEHTTTNVLGVEAGEKVIVVDLSEQRLIAKQGDKEIVSTLISSGLTNKTPVGEFRIWYKIRSTKMQGGIKGTSSYYYLPNVPYSMFFNGNIGIHGTYWHSDFGRPKSHGCINTPTGVSETLFYWTDPQLPDGKGSIRSSPENPGTRVIIKP